mgnify:CR=1 FL=1
MSRPKPVVLKEFTDKKTYRTEQVLEADAIWAESLQNQINKGESQDNK